MMAYTRFVSAPDTDTPILPQSGGGSPAFFVSSVQVLPPSVVLNRPLPGPPLDSECGVRNTSHKPAYSTSGFRGSMLRSTAPVFSSRNSTRVQVLPASTVLNTPRSLFAPYGSPRAATYATSGFEGWTRMRPMAIVLSSPT
jgi:hypothetical protein